MANQSFPPSHHPLVLPLFTLSVPSPLFLYHLSSPSTLSLHPPLLPISSFLSSPHILSSPLPGIISVYFETNVSATMPQGFNASFWVRRCPRGSERGMEDGAPVCQARAQCQGGLCQCPQGYGGPLCDHPLCPQDCGETEGRGSCNLVREDVVVYWV